MKQLRNILTPLVLFCLLAAGFPVFAQEQEEAAPKMQDEMTSKEEKENTVDVKEIVFGHIGDSYEWHILTYGDTHVSVPLPIIVYSSNTGWHAFLSSNLAHGQEYEGFYIAETGDYAGKVVEKDAQGNEVRPLDISITKTAFSLMINSLILVLIIVGVFERMESVRV